MFELQLGDLMIIGEKNFPPPAKLIKALAVIAERLHSACDQWIVKEKSKDSCVLCALTVRDFLRTIGFAARVEPVCFIAAAWESGKQLHSIGIGVPGGPNVVGPRWNGHLVVIAAGWLVDTVLYQAQRPAWPHLPGMAAVAIRTAAALIGGHELPQLASITTEDHDYRFEAVWMLNRRNNVWRRGPDNDPRRRAPIIGALVQRFGEWDE